MSREEQLREALEYALIRWNAFYPNLPDGDYEGLGMLRHAMRNIEAILSQPEPSAAPPDFKSFSQCSNVIELTAWLKENALPPYRQFALALACKLESFTPPAPAEVTAEQICKADRRTGSLHMQNHQQWGEMMAELLAAAKGGKG